MTEITPEIFKEFKDSSDTLRIYKDGQCIFKSDKDVLAPLVEYLDRYGSRNAPITVLDKVAGNAAALLFVKAGACKVFSPMGSEIASKTLSINKIDYYLENLVPFILARNGKDICPMEKLSLDKNPEEFYEAVKARFLQNKGYRRKGE